MGDELDQVRALGSDDGRLAVTWAREGDGVVLDWRESLTRIGEPAPGPRLRHAAGRHVAAPLEASMDRSHDGGEYRVALHCRRWF